MATDTLLAARKRFQLASLAAQALAAHGGEMRAAEQLNPGGGPTPPRPAVGLPNVGGPKHAPFGQLPGFGVRGMGAAATPAYANTGAPKRAPFSSAGVHQGTMGPGAMMAGQLVPPKGGPAGGKPVMAGQVTDTGGAPPSARLEALAALLGQTQRAHVGRRRRRSGGARGYSGSGGSYTAGPNSGGGGGY